MVAFGNHAAIIAPCAMMAAKISSGVAQASGQSHGVQLHGVYHEVGSNYTEYDLKDSPNKYDTHFPTPRHQPTKA